VDEFQSSVGQLIGEQRTSEADFGVEGGQRRALGLAMQARIQLVRHQIAGPHTDMGLDAIADARLPIHCLFRLLYLAGGDGAAAALLSSIAFFTVASMADLTICSMSALSVASNDT